MKAKKNDLWIVECFLDHKGFSKVLISCFEGNCGYLTLDYKLLKYTVLSMFNVQSTLLICLGTDE